MSTRVSQTYLAQADRCLQAAYLYETEPHMPSHPKSRGTAAHLVVERMLRNMIERDEPTFYAPGHTQDPKTGEAIPEDEADAKRHVASLTAAVVEEIRAEHPELVMPHDDWDKVRLMAFHWAAANPIDPARVVAIERKFVLDIDEFTVVGKVDVATLEGSHAEVIDYKTGLYLPSQEEYEASFQHKLYALLVCFGRPVRKVRCESCQGHGQMPDESDCPECLSDGFREERLDPIGGHVGWARCREVYPRILTDEGRLWERERTLTRTALADFRVDLEAILARVRTAREENEWTPVPGQHCLTTCPAPHRCPLPEAAKGPQGSMEGLRVDVPVISAENLAQEAERWFFLSEQATALKKAIRGHCASEDTAAPIGTDLELAFRVDTKRAVDWPAYMAACEEADRNGRYRPELSAYTKESKASAFVKRRAKPEEEKEAA